jgi:hypothetical protein
MTGTTVECNTTIFGVKNRVVALWNLFLKARNEPSTQLIEATSCVEKSNATIKAKERRLLSSYHTVTADKNSRR